MWLALASALAQDVEPTPSPATYDGPSIALVERRYVYVDGKQGRWRDAKPHLLAHPASRRLARQARTERTAGDVLMVAGGLTMAGGVATVSTNELQVTGAAIGAGAATVLFGLFGRSLGQKKWKDTIPLYRDGS